MKLISSVFTANLLIISKFGPKSGPVFNRTVYGLQSVPLRSLSLCGALSKREEKRLWRRGTNCEVMKGLNERLDFLRLPLAVKVSLIAVGCFAFFLLGKHWSEQYPEQFVFFNGGPPPSKFPPSPVVAISPNADKNFNISSLINSASNDSLSSDLGSPPPPPPQGFGIVDSNGTMTEDFNVGDLDPPADESWEGSGENGSLADSGNSNGVEISFQKFPVCPDSMKEYIPCLDNEEEIARLESTAKGEKFERHCPVKENRLDCVVPTPKGYKYPIPWPTSRDEVFFAKVLVSRA